MRERAIELPDLVPSTVVVRLGRERRVNFGQVIAIEQLPVRRGVPFADAVQISHPHVERIDLQMLRDRLQNVLDRSHRLRTAEAAKRRVRRQVRKTHLARELNVGQKVAVVGVQERSLHHGQRQIGRDAAVRIIGDAERLNPPVIVEANFPRAEIFVTFAGDSHVVVFVVDDAGRAARFASDQRGHHRRDRRLRFLAAKRPAHPFADANNFVLADAEHLGNERLNLGRILRRRMNEHLPLLAGVGNRRLRFEIELLLAARRELATEAIRRRTQLGIDVAAGDAPQRANKFLQADRFAHGQHGFGNFVFNANCLAGFFQRGGIRRGNDGNWLAEVQELAIRQKWLVEYHDAEQVVTRNISRRIATDDARDRQGSRRVDAQKLPGRDRASHKTHEQFAGERADVVDVRRLASHMTDRRIVRYRLSEGRHAR